MKPKHAQPPSEAEIDRLLSSQLRRTSPEFEMRWREIRTQWTEKNQRSRRLVWPRWLLWPGLATAGIAAALVVFGLREPAPPAVAPGPVSFEELLALDAALAPAAALLNPENREALIHLPAEANL